MEQLPIITQPAVAASPLDAGQFQEVAVIAIGDALPVVRGGFAIFTIYLLDSSGPVQVRVYSGSAVAPPTDDTPPEAIDPSDITFIAGDYLGFDEIITLVDPKTFVSIPTTGGAGPFPTREYFNVYIAPIDPAYAVRNSGVGTILSLTNYTTYAPGVYTDGVYV